MNPFDFPETITCPECGKQMGLYVDGVQIRSALSVSPMLYIIAPIVTMTISPRRGGNAPKSSNDNTSTDDLI